MRYVVKVLVLVLLVSLSGCLESNVVNYRETTQGRLLLGATVHLGNDEFVENAALAVKDGYVTLLAEGDDKKLDLSEFQVEKLGPEYHIYPFKATEAGNSGIVLARADAEPINIAIRDQEVERRITLGCEAQLLICVGSIKDIGKFRVDYVISGSDKVKILSQSDYAARMRKGNN